jgi:hypothetical protein
MHNQEMPWNNKIKGKDVHHKNDSLSIIPNKEQKKKKIKTGVRRR